MTLLESIITMASAVVTILGGIVFIARYFAKRLNRWADALVDNSAAVRNLTVRVTKLEQTIGNT